MRKKLLGGICLLSVGLSMSAYGADLPATAYTKAPAKVVPAFDWSGLYLGVEGGGGWARDQRTYVATTDRTDVRLGGGLAGGVIGYNWQLPATPLLLGVEGSFDWADLDGSTACPNAVYSCAEKLNQLYSGTARIGYAWQSLLLYAKGGYAWTQVDYHATYLPRPGPFDGGGTVNRDGWVAGGGVEFMFAPNWSIKAEYDYYDFGSKTAATDSGGLLHLLTLKDSELTAQTVKVGVNYRFGWNGPVAARY